MRKTLIIIILILSLALIWLSILYKNERKERKRNEGNANTLFNLNSSYIDSINGLTYMVGELTLTNKELKESTNAEVIELRQELEIKNIKIKNLNYAIIGHVQANGSGESRIDTIYKYIEKEKIQVLTSNWTDGFLRLKTIIDQPNLKHEYSYNDSVMVYCDTKKIGKCKLKNLIFPRKKEDIITSSTKNPNSSIRIIFIRKK